MKIEQIECDGEFKPLLDTVMDNMNIRMNYTNAQEHIGVAERNNRTLKEAFWVMLHRSGYGTIPRAMIIA